MAATTFFVAPLTSLVTLPFPYPTRAVTVNLFLDAGATQPYYHFTDGSGTMVKSAPSTASDAFGRVAFFASPSTTYYGQIAGTAFPVFPIVVPALNTLSPTAGTPYPVAR